MKQYMMLAMCCSIVLSCSHDHVADEHADHSHEESSEIDIHDTEVHGEKEVHLNEAQFMNAEIDTGWFAMKNLTDVIRANGYTKLDPQHEAEVSLPVAGTIQSIKVIEGNYVKKGQQVATMSSLELNDKLFLRESLREDLATARARQSFLEQERARQAKLAELNLSAQKALQKSTSDLAVENSRIAALSSKINLLDDAFKMIGRSESGRIPIVAPISGYINEIHFKLGATVAAGVPMFSIVDNSQMHVDLLVYEKDLSRVQVGQTVRFVLANQNDQEINGKIYNIGKSFASDTKSVAVHADLELNEINLMPGMYLNALINVGENEVRALPEEAIVLAEGRSFVFVMKKEHEEGHAEDEFVFSRLEVKTGSRQLGYVEVTPLGDLASDDVLVLRGAYYLQSHLQKMEGGGGHSH